MMSDPQLSELMAGRHDFAFQTGAWLVRHSKLRARLSDCRDWGEFEGTCVARELLDGAANIEEHRIEDPLGGYGAIGLRALESASGIWSIWWLDGRVADLAVPVRGRFEGGVGTFVASDVLDSRPIDVRFIWSDITPTSARWEQAFAPADTDRWEVNWVMRFERTA